MISQRKELHSLCLFEVKANFNKLSHVVHVDWYQLFATRPKRVVHKQGIPPQGYQISLEFESEYDKIGKKNNNTMLHHLPPAPESLSAHNHLYMIFFKTPSNNLAATAILFHKSQDKKRKRRAVCSRAQVPLCPNNSAPFLKSKWILTALTNDT